MKRYRRPKLKDGELRVYWGKLPQFDPDLIFSWKGRPSMSCDSQLLSIAFCSRQPDHLVQPIFSKMLPSLVEELEARGYDIETFKFSIMKKGAKK